MPFMNEHGVSQNDIYRLNVEVPIHESVSFMYSFKRLHNEDMTLVSITLTKQQETELKCRSDTEIGSQHRTRL